MSEKLILEYEVLDVMPFDAVHRWCKNNSEYCYTWVPRYRSKKRQKEYEAWLKNNVSKV